MARGFRGIEIGPALSGTGARVLTREALDYLDALAQALPSAPPEPDGGPWPSPYSSAIRSGDWKAPLPPRELNDLRSAVLSPLERKALLGGLNSGARLCLADCCGASAWDWESLMAGHANLMDRWTSAMEHVDAATGKRVSLAQRLAALMLRVRPLASDEPRVRSWGKPVPAGLFDAGLYLFHTARAALAKAARPCLCLTGVSSQGEARRWNDLLVAAQSLLGLPLGTVRVMVTVDEPRALRQLDEILHELRDHAAALSGGGHRLALASARATLARRGGALPDPLALEEAAAPHLVRAAHRRGILALSAATDPDTKREALRAVRAGFDGLILPAADQAGPAARVFAELMPVSNQTFVIPEERPLPFEDAAELPPLPPREDLFRSGIASALLHLEGWLSGGGPAAAPQAARDPAEAEYLCLAAWHWIRRGTKLDSGRKAGEDLYEDCMFALLQELKAELGEEAYHARRFGEAVVLLRGFLLARTLPEGFAILALRTAR